MRLGGAEDYFFLMLPDPLLMGSSLFDRFMLVS